MTERPAEKPEPKHLRLLRPFVLVALAACIVGVALGLVVLERMQWHPEAFDWRWRQGHAQLQVFGFIIPLVTGFALFLVPRLAGGHRVEHQKLARFALFALGVSILLAAAVPWGRAWSVALRWPLALAVASGTCSAAWALHRPIFRHLKALGSRRRAGYLLPLELAMGFLALAGLADAVALASAASRPFMLFETTWARAAWRLGLEGFACGMALGVSARMFTGFLGITPGRAYPSSRSAHPRTSRADLAYWVWVSAWAASVLVGALGEVTASAFMVHLGDLLFAVGMVPLALRLSLWPDPRALPIDRTRDPPFRFGARAAYALLVVASVIGAGAAVAYFSGHPAARLWSDARRHAITLGFLMSLIATMAGRLAPGYAGRHAAFPSLRVLAMGGFALAGVLRACEAVSAQWHLPSVLKLSAASGPVAGISFVALFAVLLGTLLRAPEPK